MCGSVGASRLARSRSPIITLYIDGGADARIKHYIFKGSKLTNNRVIRLFM